MSFVVKITRQSCYQAVVVCGGGLWEGKGRMSVLMLLLLPVWGEAVCVGGEGASRERNSTAEQTLL